MQDLLEEATLLMITVGTQLVEFGATRVEMHVDIVVTPSILTVASSVDTIVETAFVEISDVPKSVAVGVCRQAMRRNYS